MNGFEERIQPHQVDDAGEVVSPGAQSHFGGSEFDAPT